MSEKKKNVLIIFSDQQHKYALGKVNRRFHTPNLDRLAEDGVLFENAYSNNPLCGPYRGCLLTGLLTSHSKMYDNGDRIPDNMPTIASEMETLGYETCFVGKWHTGGNGDIPIPEELRGGFRHFIGYQCYNGFDPSRPFNNKVTFYDENNRTHTFKKHRTDVTTDLAVEKLRTVCKSGNPFLTLVGYQAPHYPVQPLPQFADLYKDAVFEKTPDFVDIDPYTPTFSPPSPRPAALCPDYQRYGGSMDNYMRLYAGMVSQIDFGVGRIINELKELNVYDSTLIIYTSDHGDMQGSHGFKNKCLAYEKSCGVPFVAVLPGGTGGVHSKSLVSSVDILPTVLEAAGAKPGFPVDGTSFYSHVQSGAVFERDYVIAEYPLKAQSGYPWRMIRNNRYKLVTDFCSYNCMYLFDMENDPWEMENISEKPEMEKVIRELTETLKLNTSL